MANSYYTRTKTFTAGTKAKGSDVVSELDSVLAGFDKLPTPDQLESGSPNHVTAGGTADAITFAAPQTTWTTYTGKDGYEFTFQVVANNTDPVTINVDSVGPVALKRSDAAALQADDLVATSTVSVVYNESAGLFYVKHSVPSLVADQVAGAPAALETGIVKATGVAFEGTVSDGDAVYWDGGNNRYAKAIADGSAAQEAVGIADVTNSKAELSGVMSSLTTGLTAGTVYYLSASVAGALSTTEGVVKIGVARTTSALLINVTGVANPSVDYQEFISSGTWTKPADTLSVYVEVVGAGGGGGGDNAASVIASGGGGGGWIGRTIQGSDVSSSVTITVGAGGLGAPDGTTTGAGGSSGGSSSFGGLATGGGGGGSLSSNYGGSGGGIYELRNVDGPNTSHYDCGSGGGSSRSPGSSGGNCIYGGGGGGYCTASATVFPGGTSQIDGDGGSGNTTASTKGGDGLAPGGGGGGSNNDGGGGDGAGGIVRVWSYLK